MLFVLILMCAFGTLLCCACLNQAAKEDEYAERQYEEMLCARQERETL